MNEPSSSALGFVGLGAMGNPMAANLLRAGHRLTVTDLVTKRGDDLVGAGASWALGPAETAAASEVTFLSLPDPAAVEEVVCGAGGVLSGARSGSTIVDLSTNSPTMVRALAARAAAAGVAFLDAPVSGGVAGARKGTLALMVGGDHDTFEKHRDVLGVLGDRVFHLGDVGAGSVAKLVNNMLFFHGVLGTVEALVLAAKSGVDLSLLRDVVNAGSGASFAFSNASNAILKDRLAPSFTVALAAKDAGLALELAADLDLALPSSRNVRDLLLAYRDDGFAAEDVLGIVKALEREAGVIVRGRQSAPEHRS